MSERSLEDLRRAPRRISALLYIATHPDTSNREIALAIGIGDDAQISRLLAGMQDLGLAFNRTRAGNHGGANAWQLTADGRRLVGDLTDSLD